ncbi:MAG: DUF3574 domain-containing protein [Chloroflexi bacterium]|nr:DUF3574 domain-containing protein [Chloroflexota bacterium]
MPVKNKTRTVCLVLALFALQACSAGGDDSSLVTLDCPDGYQQFTEFNVYFGRENGDGSEVSQQEWDDFLAEVVTPRLPDGLTVLDGRGQWLNTDTDRVYREDTKVVDVLIPVEATDDGRVSLSEISDIYLARFDQQVVFKSARPARAGL